MYDVYDDFDVIVTIYGLYRDNIKDTFKKVLTSLGAYWGQSETKLN